MRTQSGSGEKLKSPGTMGGWISRGVAIVNQAAFFVGVARGTEPMRAAITEPLLAGDIEIEIFGDADSVFVLG